MCNGKPLSIGITAYLHDEEAPAMERLRHLKNLGYDAIDYQNLINTDASVLFSLPDRAFEEQLCKHRQWVEDAGLRIHQVHGPWRYPPMDATPEQRQERKEKMERALWGTHLLGSSFMVLHPLMPFGPGDDPDPTALWNINKEFFLSLLPTAEKWGVTICLENMPMTALSNSTPQACVQLVKEIRSPYLQLCLDTGHCAVFGISPADALHTAGGLLRVLHIHDNDGKHDYHWLPGEGVIDWEAFHRELKAVGFAGVISLETAPSDSLSPAEYEKAEQQLVSFAKRMAE